MTELERCRVWIEAALEYSGGTHIYEDVVTAIVEGKMQLWPAEKSCWVTEITVYHERRCFMCFWLVVI